MKWSLQQLKKIISFPFEFNVLLDFKEDKYQNVLKEREDVYNLGEVKVSGKIIRIDDETYEFNYNIKSCIEMACSLTLEPVNFNLDENFDEIYSTKESENEDYYLIEKNTIDLDEMVWTNILLSLPIRIVRDDAYEILKERGITFEDSEE